MTEPHTPEPEASPPPPASPPEVAPEAPVEGLLGGDWPARATDTVEQVVQQIRSKTAGPATTVSRAIVYGLVGAVLGIIALALTLVLLIRLLNVIIPGDVWIVYLVLGLICATIGFWLWSASTKPPKAKT